MREKTPNSEAVSEEVLSPLSTFTSNLQVTAGMPPEVVDAFKKVMDTLSGVLEASIPNDKRVTISLRYVVCPEVRVSVEKVEAELLKDD